LGFRQKTSIEEKIGELTFLWKMGNLNMLLRSKQHVKHYERTLERQEKYKRDGIVGCWLFLNGLARLENEREDLPLFL
jgi:hypothetical protein